MAVWESHPVGNWGINKEPSAANAPEVPVWPSSDARQPWTCPKCGRVWAPYVPGCFSCNGKAK